MQCGILGLGFSPWAAPAAAVIGADGKVINDALVNAKKLRFTVVNENGETL
jgi:hypothetical protein